MSRLLGEDQDTYLHKLKGYFFPVLQNIDSDNLHFRFYVHDVSLLEDEVTRLHYFLQLKLDVIEGRLRCNYEQAIVLASYSLQAEFGDHDPEKHTLEYLQDFPLLPKPMLTQFPEDKIGTLTDAIISQHASLRGIQQQLAEVRE